jgi:hypothetical protein
MALRFGLLLVLLPARAQEQQRCQPGREQMLLQTSARAPGTPGYDVVDNSFLGKGYDFLETDLWTFENVYPSEFYRLDIPDTCFRVRMCPHVETVETNFFDSVEEFSRSFFSSFGIELSGKFMGIEGSLSASIEKSMSQSGSDAKSILSVRMYKRGACYQMRGECAFNKEYLSDHVKEALQGLPTGRDDAEAMQQWEEHFVRRFGTHISLGSEHGAQIRATATSNSNERGMESYLRTALNAEISLEWGQHVGGSFGVSSNNSEEDSRSTKSVSYSTRCSTIGGDPEAESPCISQHGERESSTDRTNTMHSESRLRAFFNQQDLTTGQSVFSMYLKEMADVFNHMGYSDYSHAMRKATEFHTCKTPQFKWAASEEGEHQCRCDLECKNGGVLDHASCTCNCPRDTFHGYRGADCSEEFGTCQAGANSGNKEAARMCAVNNVCASAVWKGYCHNTEVCCLTHFKGTCCPFGHTCGCDVDSCECIPPANGSVAGFSF